MRGVVPAAFDALLTPHSEGQVGGLVGLPICHARCPGVAGLAATTSLFPWMLFVSSPTINDLGTVLVKRFRASSTASVAIGMTLDSIIVRRLDTVARGALRLNGRLLHVHRLQPLSAILAGPGLTYKFRMRLWTYGGCPRQPLRPLLLPRSDHAAKRPSATAHRDPCL